MGRPKLPSTEVVVFNGVRYLRQPGEDYYRNRRNGGDRLHRDVWRFYHGDIPKGFDIHHKDGDPGNNDVDNLECLSKVGHGKRHGERLRTPEHLAFLAKIRPLGDAWHQSEAGRNHHREHGRKTLKAMWEAAPFREYPCVACGKPFTSRAFQTPMYCSDVCYDRNRVRQYKRDCVYCGKEFVTGESRTKNCSRKCGALWRRARL